MRSPLWRERIPGRKLSKWEVHEVRQNLASLRNRRINRDPEATSLTKIVICEGI